MTLTALRLSAAGLITSATGLTIAQGLPATSMAYWERVTLIGCLGVAVVVTAGALVSVAVWIARKLIPALEGNAKASQSVCDAVAEFKQTASDCRRIHNQGVRKSA